MTEKAQQLTEEIKAKAAEIGKKHAKAMFAEFNTEVTPLAIDLATEMIPGEIDNVIAIAAKPVLVKAIEAAVEAI